MKIGYARVSTADQNLDLQRQALEAAGCEVIFEDSGISGATQARQGLTEALSRVQAGDTLVVWKLDRLGRSLGFLIELMDKFRREGSEFQSLTDGIDTTTSGGKLIFHIMGALAEFERDLIRERTTAGMQAAKRRGKHVGRPPALTAEQVAHARQAIAGGESIAGMASVLGVHRNTLKRALQATAGV